MPTNRSWRGRRPVSRDELGPGALAFLAGEWPPEDCGLWAWNEWDWLNGRGPSDQPYPKAVNGQPHAGCCHISANELIARYGDGE